MTESILDIANVKIGFTGTQQGMDKSQLEQLEQLLIVDYHKGAEFHHGDCIGADEQAHAIARKMGYQIIIHPPKKPDKRAFCQGDRLRPEFDYATRNHHIVDQTNALIAAPVDNFEVIRSGTWATVRYARRLRKPVVMLHRNEGIILC